LAKKTLQLAKVAPTPSISKVLEERKKTTTSRGCALGTGRWLVVLLLAFFFVTQGGSIPGTLALRGLVDLVSWTEEI
jgi:hypothetical protein